MNKINFKWFKERGYKLAAGDTAISNNGVEVELEECDLKYWNDTFNYDELCWVTSFKNSRSTFEAALLDYNKSIAKAPESKLVFTQEMADAEELPPVGSLVCFDGNNVQIIGYTTSGYPAFEYENGYVDSFVECSVYTPIDTRTDQEKLIDELIVALTKIKSEIRPTSRDAIDLMAEFNITRKESK